MSLLRFIPCFLCIFSFVVAEERFLLVNGTSGQTVFQLGSQLDERMSPCSTFKIPLSLMGYDAEILKDEQTPIWQFQEGYDDFLGTWKCPQSPRTWMHYSCIWYSKLISCQLGLKKMHNYLSAFAYGNQDMSVGLIMPGKADPAWFHSSPLRISLREQVDFIRKMLQNKLQVTNHATDMTKAILFKEDLAQGWKLFGKTGWSGSIGRDDDTVLEYAWFVGWIEKDIHFFPFAYFIRDKKIALDQRTPRVKQLIAGIIDLHFSLSEIVNLL
jgi:beta-lactamase class D